MSFLCFLFAAITVPLLLIAVLYWKQDLLVYMSYLPPGCQGIISENFVFGSHRPDDVWLRTSDGVLFHSWFFKLPNSRAHPTILFFHGNAGIGGVILIPGEEDKKYFVSKSRTKTTLVNRSPASLYEFCCDAVLMYGQSEGTPSEIGLQRDAVRALEHLLFERDDIDPQSIFVFGRSLGGAVAIFLASNDPAAGNLGKYLRGCMVENTFTSIPETIESAYPMLRRLKFLCRNKWPSLERAHQLQARSALVICGLRDTLIPPSHSRSIFEAIPSARGRRLVDDSTSISTPALKEIFEIPEATHNDCPSFPGYYERIKTYVDRAMRLIPPPAPE